MKPALSNFVRSEDTAKPLIGDLELKDGTERYRGHVIGYREREVILHREEAHLEALLSRPALSSYVEEGEGKRSIVSFGLFDGYEVGRLYVRDTIRDVMLRPYKFLSVTISCSEDRGIYCAGLIDRLHFSVSFPLHAFETLANIVRLKRMCAIKLPAAVWRGPQLNYGAVETNETRYVGDPDFFDSDEPVLDFGYDELRMAAFGT